MLEIIISSELANADPGFMAGCANRGHEVGVFENVGTGAEAREVSVAAQGVSEAVRDGGEEERPGRR